MSDKKQSKPIDQSKHLKADEVKNSTVIFGDNTGKVEINVGDRHIAHNIDPIRLAEELMQLRTAMRGVAESSDHDSALGEIAKAETAANKNDMQSVFAHLKAAGTWALEIASKIGVSVAADALKQALGIP